MRDNSLSTERLTLRRVIKRMSLSLSLSLSLCLCLSLSVSVCLSVLVNRILTLSKRVGSRFLALDFRITTNWYLDDQVSK